MTHTRNLCRTPSVTLLALTFIAVTAASATVFADPLEPDPRPPLSPTLKAAAPPALPQRLSATKTAAPPKPRPAASPGTTPQLIYLVRSALMTLDDANRTGNYSVLRDRSGTAFQKRNSAADLAQTFHGFRAQRIDLAAAALLEPQLIGPVKRPNAETMIVTGGFATVPRPVLFELGFVAEDGQWRIDQLSVGLGADKTQPEKASPPRS